MKPSRIKELRAELEAERIDLSELSEIETAFAALPDDFLRDERENAMAADQLDELERWNENAIHRATDKFDTLTKFIGGSHGMLVGAMHKLIYDELNNGSGNWDNGTSRLARQIVAHYLDDQAPGWLTKNIGNHWSLPAAEQDRKPKHVTDASWIKLIEDVLTWLRVDSDEMTAAKVKKLRENMPGYTLGEKLVPFATDWELLEVCELNNRKAEIHNRVFERSKH